MVEKVGRNDPCPCGSGKKYKSCCLLKEQQATKPLGQRKFTAKLLSGKALNKEPASAEDQQSHKVMSDYASLMERSYGSALHPVDNKPPVPSDPSIYLGEDDASKK